MPERSRGLTLLELVVVLAILVVLAGLIVPIIAGLGYQTNAATNATVADDVARAVRMFRSRLDVEPYGWDSLIGPNGALFAGLHQSLTSASPSSSPILIAHTLSGDEIESLKSVGIGTIYNAVDGSSPNVSHISPKTIKENSNNSDENNVNVAVLSKTSTAALTLLRTSFGITTDSPLPQSQLDGHEFVVFGLGPSTSIRGEAIAEVPLIQSADPTHYYARVLCVYRVPGVNSSAAEFLGCLLPDGTGRTDNIENYNNVQSDRN